MFTILKRDENGELTEVAQTETREAAEKVITRMKRLFPADQYELKEADSGSGGTGSRS
jgi:hypothetical protein